MNRILQFAFAYVFLTIANAAPAAPRYTSTDLGIISGSSLTPTCLSDSGVIAGTASDGRLFIRSASGDICFVSPPAGYASIHATSVNDNGEAIGYFHNGYTDRHAFVYRPDTGVTAVGAEEGWHAGVFAINNSGTVVGYSTDRYYSSFKFYALTRTTMEYTTVTGSGSRCEPLPWASINDQGHMLYCYQDQHLNDWGWEALFREVLVVSDGQTRSLNISGEVADASPTTGRRLLAANDMNNRGQIVGMQGQFSKEWGDPGIPLGLIGGDARGYYDAAHAFVYTPESAPVDLGVLPGFDSFSDALAINDNGQVVGYSWFDGGPIGCSYCAFLYYDGDIYDLNALTGDSTDGWLLTYAGAINNRGQIIAEGQRRVGYRWEYRTFLLTPVPEPSSFATVLSGLAAAVFLILRRNRCN